MNEFPELDGMKIIKTREELEAFLAPLRQDSYSKERLQRTGILQKLYEWIDDPQQESKPGDRFLAVESEPDSFAMNDGWGMEHMYYIVIVGLRSGKTVIKSEAYTFAH